MEIEMTKQPRITVVTSLYNSRQYLEGYFEAVAAIANKDEIEILLIHNAPNAGEMEIINKFLPRFPFVKHFEVEREGLYASWNRGIKLAKGNYVTIWNVDDVRLPNSLSDQAGSLDQHPNAALSYGDFIIVSKYGHKEGKFIDGPAFQSRNRKFSRQFHITCFPMWRKDIHSVIGYFDEQFKIIADFDFQVRVAARFSLVKLNVPLGFYLQGTSSNLSSNSSLQDMELTALHLRYGNFDSLNLPHLLTALRKIKLFRHKWFGSYHKMTPWRFKNFFWYGVRIPLILVSIMKFPRHMARLYLKRHLNRWFPRKTTQEKLSTSSL